MLNDPNNIGANVVIVVNDWNRRLETTMKKKKKNAGQFNFPYFIK